MGGGRVGGWFSFCLCLIPTTHERSCTRYSQHANLWYLLTLRFAQFPLGNQTLAYIFNWVSFDFLYTGLGPQNGPMSNFRGFEGGLGREVTNQRSQNWEKREAHVKGARIHQSQPGVEAAAPQALQVVGL